MKPEAPAEYRGVFRPVANLSPGHPALRAPAAAGPAGPPPGVVRSLGHHGRGTGDHHAGYYYNLTGHAPDPTFRQLLNDRKPSADRLAVHRFRCRPKRPAAPVFALAVSLPQKPGGPNTPGPASSPPGSAWSLTRSSS